MRGVLVDDGLLAVLRRHTAERGAYLLLPGGLVEPNESPEDAVVRELREELGITVEVVAPIAQVRAPGGTLNRFFLVRRISGELGSGRDHDYDQPVWLTPADALAGNLRPPSIARLVARVSEGASWPRREVFLDEE